MRKDSSEPVSIQALRTMAKEFNKIYARYEKKREEEIKKLTAFDRSLEETTYEELHEMYGWGFITRNEFNEKVLALENYKNNNSRAVDKETPISTFLKYLKKEIYNINIEIKELETERQKNVK